jgi:hypothetical protein
MSVPRRLRGESRAYAFGADGGLAQETVIQGVADECHADE